VRLYHATSEEAAVAIMADGFRQPTEPGRGIQLLMNGVFFADVPVDRLNGAKGGVVIEVEIETTPGEMFYKYEIIDGRDFREFLIPDARVNGSPRRILSQEETAYAVERGGWGEYPPGEPDRRIQEDNDDPDG